MKAILLIFLLFCTYILHAQPGTLDKNFGNSGIIVDSGREEYPLHIALQADGKSIAAGSTVTFDKNNQPSENFLLTRRNQDGSLDSSFGDKGSVITSYLPSSSEACYAIAVQADGRIVAAGNELAYLARYNHVFIACYLPDGSLDKSFGKEGLVDFSIADKTNAFVTGTAVQKDGKIVVMGNSTVASNKPRYAFLVRFNTDGTPDESFGNNGVLFLSQPYIELYTIVLQPDGDIVVGGADPLAFTSFFTLFRYLPDGTPDKSFGNDGEAMQGFGDNTYAIPYSLALQADGSIVCGGYGQFPGKEYIEINQALVRFTPSGNVDASFGTGGTVITRLSDWLKDSAWSQVAKVLIQPDGKIVAAGSLTLIPEYSNATTLLRYYPDGTVDSSFGTNGLTTTSIENGLICNDALLQKDGKFLLGDGGYITLSQNNVWVFARYNNDVGKRQQIVIKVKRWLQHYGITWAADNDARYYTVQRSHDGGVTYQPVTKLYNNHQPTLTYEDASARGDNAVYRVAVVAKDGARSFSNSVALTDEAGVRVFPNPVRSMLQVQGLPANTKSRISITDFGGSVRMSAVATGSTASLNTSALKPGNYLLKVQNGNTVTTRVFVKE